METGQAQRINLRHHVAAERGSCPDELVHAVPMKSGNLGFTVRADRAVARIGQRD